MSIIGILRKRDSGAGFRTVDGGNPAPYPDMTDEQLYNYENTFNVPRKTFSQRPASSAARPAAKPASGKVLDSKRFTARQTQQTQQTQQPRQPELRPVPEVRTRPEVAAPLDLSKPVRLVTTRQPVEIITTRARHPVFKVHGYIGDDSVATVFTLAGQLSENGPCFLENVPEQRQLHLNIYPNHNAADADKFLITQHATRKEADANARPGRLTCAAVLFDG